MGLRQKDNSSTNVRQNLMELYMIEFPVIERITSQDGFSEIHYLFECPGCGIGHAFRTHSESGLPTWDFNNDVVRPTFRPSLLVDWSDVDYRKVCHSFVTDGRIQFLSDSYHALAGMTVDMEICNEV